MLMEPLVDQIENEEPCDNDEDSAAASSAYRTFVSQHLAPCIGNFASCCLNDDALVRKFNYQVLLKTKSSSPQVRLATMDVLNVFSKKIGDIYNSYLPETVPFLAELMEGNKLNFLSVNLIFIYSISILFLRSGRRSRREGPELDQRFGGCFRRIFTELFCLDSFYLIF